MSYDCYCDYDPPSVSRSRLVKARKYHRCEECPRIIQPGEQYRYTFAIWDGYPSSTYVCADCLHIQKWVQTNIPCFCWYSGTMLHDAKEAISEAYFRAGDEVRGVMFGFLRLIVKAKRSRAAPKPPVSAS